MKKVIIGIVVALVLIAIAMPLTIAAADAGLPLDHVALTPSSVTLATNGTQQFTAVGQDSANAPVADVNYTWSVIAGTGTISTSGLYTAGSTAGTSTVQVVATQGIITKTALATVTVVVPGPLDHVALTPATVTIPISGTQQFTAVGQDSANVPAIGVNYTWSVIAGTGSISTSGLYTAAATAGTSTVQVVATQGIITKTATATVTVVVVGALDHVVLTPTSASVSVGGTQQFTAVGQDSANVPVTGVNYTWAVTAGSGTISTSGLLTAGSTAGTSTVQVTATQGSISKTATAIVTVSTGQREEDEDRFEPHGWEHGKKKGWGGEHTPPGWSKGNKKGWGDEHFPPGLMKAKRNHESDDESSEED